jgi:hypothetical protein
MLIVFKIKVLYLSHGGEVLSLMRQPRFIPTAPRRILVLISVRSLVNPKAIVQLEGFVN